MKKIKFDEIPLEVKEKILFPEKITFVGKDKMLLADGEKYIIQFSDGDIVTYLYLPDDEIKVILFHRFNPSLINVYFQIPGVLDQLETEIHLEKRVYKNEIL